VDNNVKVNKSKDYDYFHSLVSGQYSDDEIHEAETKVTENFSLSNEQEAYLFDTQARKLYSGSALDIRLCIRQWWDKLKYHAKSRVELLTRLVGLLSS
jgi:hypothetical protein